MVRNKNINFDFEMKLSPEPFAVTKSGSKRIEVRLNDDRRKSLEKGKTIKFVNTTDSSEALFVSIKDIRKYPNLRALVDAEDISRTGGLYKDSEDWYEKLKSYYPQSDGESLAIEIELLNSDA